MSDHAADYTMVIQNEASNVDTFRRLTFTGRRRGQALAYAKVVVRPVMIKECHHLQFSYFDAKKDITQNHSGAAIVSALAELLEMPFKQIHLQTAAQDIRVQLSNNGEARISSGKPTLTDTPNLAHNRTKDYLISGEHSESFLRRIQIMDSNGDIKPTMQSKYRQIHEFLSRIEPIISDRNSPSECIEIVDCGCGSAYLTFAAYHYLKFTRNLTPHIVGIDRDPATIDKCRSLRDDLGWKGLDFFEADIANYEPDINPEL
ncbi:MAG: methyltransferase, partial [Candidatus Latescibacteria bacterium]|nr:methyltransferase [Candidatus Latescibacterota bacterium]